MKSGAREYSTSIVHHLLTSLNKKVCTDTVSFLELLESFQDALFSDIHAFNLLGKMFYFEEMFLTLNSPK